MTKRPDAPTQNPVELRGDYSRASSDYTVAQEWERYSTEEHEIWRVLYERQVHLLERYAAPEVIAGARALNASPDRIPRMEDTNLVLERATGWQVVAVPGLIP